MRRTWSNAVVRINILRFCDRPTLRSAMMVSREAFKEAMPLAWESSSLEAYRNLCSLGLEPVSTIPTTGAAALTTLQKRLLRYLKPIRRLECSKSDFPPNHHIKSLDYLFNLFPNLQILRNNDSVLILPPKSKRRTAPALHVYRTQADLYQLSDTSRFQTRIDLPEAWKVVDGPILVVESKASRPPPLPLPWSQLPLQAPAPGTNLKPFRVSRLEGFELRVKNREEWSLGAKVLHLFGTQPGASIGALSLRLDGVEFGIEDFDRLAVILPCLRMDDLFLHIQVTKIPIATMLLNLCSCLNKLRRGLRTLDIILGHHLPPSTDNIQLQTVPIRHFEDTQSESYRNDDQPGLVKNRLHLRFISEFCCQDEGGCML